MHCSHCGTQLPSSANYCMNCGTAVSRPSAEERLPFGMPAPSEPQPSLQPPLFEQPQPFEASRLPGQPDEPTQQESPDDSEPQPFYQPDQPRRVSKQSIALVAIALVIIVGGLLYYQYGNGEGAQSTPEKTVKSYIEAVDEGDGASVISLLTPDSFPEENQGREEMISQMERALAETNIIDYEIGEVKIDNDQAVVKFTVTVSYGGIEHTEEAEFRLVRIDGKWYVNNG